MKYFVCPLPVPAILVNASDSRSRLNLPAYWRHLEYLKMVLTEQQYAHHLAEHIFPLSPLYEQFTPPYNEIEDECVPLFSLRCMHTTARLPTKLSVDSSEIGAAARELVVDTSVEVPIEYRKYAGPSVEAEAIFQVVPWASSSPAKKSLVSSDSRIEILKAILRKHQLDEDQAHNLAVSVTRFLASSERTPKGFVRPVFHNPANTAKMMVAGQHGIDVYPLFGGALNDASLLESLLPGQRSIVAHMLNSILSSASATADNGVPRFVSAPWLRAYGTKVVDVEAVIRGVSESSTEDKENNDDDDNDNEYVRHAKRVKKKVANFFKDDPEDSVDPNTDFLSPTTRALLYNIPD